MSGARREFIGEFVGTFLLVFFGCGAVAAAVLTSAQVGVWQIAVVWGIAIALAIQLTADLSGAHLNTSVTLALAVWRGFPWAKVPRYLAGQFAGAFLAAAALYAIFGSALAAHEAALGLTRGQPGSEATAMVLAEFFPSPGGKPFEPAAASLVTPLRAMLIEIIGTALLLFVILGLTDARNRTTATPAARAAVPWAIGFTVAILISLLGPLTMACFNPARDLAPRLFTALAGWGTWAFRAQGWGWLTVYVVAPILGGQLGAALHRWFLAPAYAAARAAEAGPADER